MGHGVPSCLGIAPILPHRAKASPVYDVILSDTKMPVLDGQGFFTELERRHPELRRRVAFLRGDVLRERERQWNTLRVISDQG